MTVEQIQSGVTADREKHQLTFERVFDAPRALVWKAFTEADRLAQWWGPRGWQNTTYTLDATPGGTWHYCMRGPDGMESWGKAIYREVVEPERLVYLDVFSNAEGGVVEGMPTMVITVEFAERDGKTVVTSRTDFASDADLQSVLDMGAVQGFTETWDRLAEYLAAQPS
jgi:uncharacterized protein YndB with AHSA1/START domain